MPGAIRLLFDQIKAAGVAAGDFAALGQNQLKQRIRLAFSRERDPDLVERLKVSGHPMELAQGVLPLLKGAQALESALHRLLDHHPRHVVRQQGKHAVA